VRVGSLVKLISHFTPNTYKTIGVVISAPNEASLVEVWWTDNSFPKYLHVEELDVLAF